MLAPSTTPNTDPESPAVSQRWHAATVRNSPLAWHALADWMAAESLMHEVDGDAAAADDMRALSDLAFAHYINLLPDRIEEMAA